MHSRVGIRILAGALAIGAAVTLSGCGATSADENNSGHGARITVGAHDTVENRILAQVYGQVLADHGYLVDYNEGVGDRAASIAALQSGRVDLVPETSGELLYAIDAAAFARSDDDIEEALPEAVESIKLRVLEAAPADKAVAFVVTEDFARNRQVASIGELAYFADDITIGADDGFQSERYGPGGLLSVYGVVGFDTRDLTDGGGTATLGALLTDSVQVAVIPAASPSILRNNLRVLADPKNLITAQNIVPLVNLTGDSPDVHQIVDPVSAVITTEELRVLNERATASATPSPETIAREWLVGKGLIRE
ncbi:ABC transporter substrate-binding protein [Conyzicola nivalis]|uniref:Amino acid ABC transporter, substrate binding protein n=1 Tax=Conyzicola nivalis TaxID=1477021 RepID=A0A916SFI8_9MICO|nr:ABC transporter substrate-binding protein [Conyzicola nivalis]GGA98341.1 putative amino acid ABC transporter, substrate binding protein [Conyzicola nivalis]